MHLKKEFVKILRKINISKTERQYHDYILRGALILENF